MSAPKVAILDVGMGNMHSVVKAFERAGATPRLVSKPGALGDVERLVFPGQGAYRELSEHLSEGFGDALREWLALGRPYLGICLGMQALFQSSEEAPGCAGLGLYDGTVDRFSDDLHDADGRALKVPHMGWNQVRTEHPLLDDNEWYYFVHSYRVVPADASLTVATCDYGGPFCAAIAKDNVFACQFHPEKSQHAGARLIERFLGGAAWN